MVAFSHQGRRHSLDNRWPLICDLRQTWKRRGRGALPSHVLRLLADSGRSQDIASELALTEITVKRKVQEITTKLNASNRVQAVAEAIRRGVI